MRSGHLQVIDTHPDTLTERVIDTIGPGDAFGELGVATGAPRTATVRSIAPAELIVVDKNTFDRLLADQVRTPDFRPTVYALTELRALPAFANLDLTELAQLIELGAWQQVPPGEILVREGDVGDAFFVVGAGRCEVTRAGTEIRVLGPNEHFGEIALLADVPRTATVRALTPTRVFRLERAGFDQLLAGAFGSGPSIVDGVEYRTE